MLSPYIRTGDLAGHRFGALSVVSFAGTTPHAEWNCKCDCGEHRKVRATRLLASVVIACARCSKAKGAAKGGRTRELSADDAALRSIFATYRENARRRGIKFELSQSDIALLLAGSCYYCGSPPCGLYISKNKTRSHSYNGIDRLDNKDGYTVGNSVSCCSTCNFAKREMAAADFVAWAKRVAEHAK